MNGTFQKWANYKHLSNNVAQTGITAYNNPYVVYDSQIIHVVTVTGLLPGVTYYYKPVDSCRLFSFKMPPKSDGKGSSIINLFVYLNLRYFHTYSTYMYNTYIHKRYMKSSSMHICTFIHTFINTYSNGHNFCKIRFLKTIDNEYLYKRCLYEVFCVK